RRSTSSTAALAANPIAALRRIWPNANVTASADLAVHERLAEPRREDVELAGGRVPPDRVRAGIRLDHLALDEGVYVEGRDGARRSDGDEQKTPREVVHDHVRHTGQRQRRERVPGRGLDGHESPTIGCAEQAAVDQSESVGPGAAHDDAARLGKRAAVDPQ